MKQTAVEWLIDQLTEYNYLQLSDKPDDMVALLSIIPQAKEIEKQQIIKAYQQGVTEEYGDTLDFTNDTDAEEYYNHTFKKDEL
jgi:hypothetical protein